MSGLRCQVSGIRETEAEVSAGSLWNDYCGRFAADWAASVAQRRAGSGGGRGTAGTGAGADHGAVDRAWDSRDSLAWKVSGDAGAIGCSSLEWKAKTEHKKG